MLQNYWWKKSWSLALFFPFQKFHHLSSKAAILDSCDARARIAEAQARTSESQTEQTGVISLISQSVVFISLVQTKKTNQLWGRTVAAVDGSEPTQPGVGMFDDVKKKSSEWYFGETIQALVVKC